jgi:hypothetical protein
VLRSVLKERKKGETNLAATEEATPTIPRAISGPRYCGCPSPSNMWITTSHATPPDRSYIISYDITDVEDFL